MTSRYFLGAIVAFCVSAHCAAIPSIGELCTQDLETLPGFLLENDSGAKAHLEQFGQKHFDDAFATAKQAASSTQEDTTCSKVLSTYLKAWRKGHLQIVDIPSEHAVQDTAVHGGAPAQIDPSYRQASLRVLSGKTLLLTLNSFGVAGREQIIALIKRHRRELAAHPNWIIDVRKNGGGGDDSYYPLLPWLMPDESVGVNVDLLATPANIEGAQKLCPLVAPGDKICAEGIARRVEKMRGVEAGHYVANESKDGLAYYRQVQLEKHRPARVAVLIDQDCASSCEQFLLAVRQSFNVKLLGRRTYGALDYSNMEPHSLPSGKRLLFYAVSRSMRIPNLPVDNIGVLPDIYLPPPTDEKGREEEVLRTRRWLEGGTLAPQAPAA